jgi:hypothetical protein
MPANILLSQVTRIPITGPAPYNTLVCVSAETYLGPQQLRDGELSRFPIRLATPFRLAGFDQRVAPVFDHSTTAWISSIGPIKDGNWIYAVDSVTGAGFSPVDGAYYLDLMAASSPDGSAPGTCSVFGEGGTICFYFVRIQVTSWVLCYEPPIAPSPQAHVHRLNDLVGQSFASAAFATPTPAEPREAVADHTQRILQQFAIPVTVSMSKPRNANHSHCACAESGCPLCTD